ncbi:MAG: methyltransferase domain-containing protein [Rhodospirillales bacterium]|nr:methyltransferase domain-containing protein [Rhodospirillales bacterium]
MYGSIVQGLPLKNASADGVYCSHVLEHLDRQSVAVALRNTHAMLRPGGVFRLVVPDLIWRARQLVEESEVGRRDAADRFMRISYLGEETPIRSLVQRLRAAYGNSAHRWMYDYGLMTFLLEESGFTAIRRCKFGDAEDPMFNRVEEVDRFYDSSNEELAIESQRPSS